MSRIVQATDSCLLLFILLCLGSATVYSQPTKPHPQPVRVQRADSAVAPLKRTSDADFPVSRLPAEKNSVHPAPFLQPLRVSSNKAGTRSVVLSSILLLIGFSLFYRRLILNRKTAVQAAEQKILTERKPVFNRLLSDEGNLFHGMEHHPEQQQSKSNEMYHRVKNNVQNVLALLNAPSELLDPETLQAIENNSRQLYVIALMHHKKKESMHGGSIDINDCIPDLIENLAGSSQEHLNARIVFSSPSRCIELETSQALALAMVINDVLSWFIIIAETNYFVESVGLYLQETKGLVKLTVKAEGLYRSKDLEQLNKGLRQTLVSHFAEAYNTRFSIDNNLGIQINVQFEKQMARKPALA